MKVNAKKHENSGPVTFRWERILALPKETWFYTLDSGKRYQVQDFKRPLFKDGTHKKVDVFETNSGELVYVPFLRLLVDKSSCSLTNSERGK